MNGSQLLHKCGELVRFYGRRRLSAGGKAALNRVARHDKPVNYAIAYGVPDDLSDCVHSSHIGRRTNTVDGDFNRTILPKRRRTDRHSQPHQHYMY